MERGVRVHRGEPQQPLLLPRLVNKLRKKNPNKSVVGLGAWGFGVNVHKRGLVMLLKRKSRREVPRKLELLAACMHNDQWGFSPRKK